MVPNRIFFFKSYRRREGSGASVTGALTTESPELKVLFRWDAISPK